MDRYSISVPALCFRLLVLLILFMMSSSRSCMATTFVDNTRYTTPRRVRTSIPTVIRRAIAEIPGSSIIEPDFTHSYTDIVASYRIRVTLTYCIICMDRNNIPQVSIIGQDFINRCNGILTDMINRYNRPYGNTIAFRPTSIRGVDQGVRLQYVATRIHDELSVRARRPSPAFVPPPPVTDLSKVQVVDNGSLKLHGQPPNGSFIYVLDYDPADCPIDASYLVSNDDINGEELATNEYLESPQHGFRLVMQTDCNLVLYDIVDSNYVDFATGTNGLGENCYTLMQTDCNLVVYDSNHNPLWASNTDYGASDRLDCLLSVDDGGSITIWATYFTSEYPSANWTTVELWSAGV